MLQVKDLLCSEEETRLEDIIAGKSTGSSLVLGSKIGDLIQTDTRLSALAARRFPDTHPDVELSAPLSNPRIECPFLSSSATFPLSATLHHSSQPVRPFPPSSTQTSPLRPLSTVGHAVTATADSDGNSKNTISEEHKSQPTMMAVDKDQICKVAVFVGEIARSDPTIIEVHKTNETLFSFSQRVEQQLGIPMHSQTIKVLQSPEVAVYTMKTMPSQQAHNTKIPTSCAFFINKANRETSSPSSNSHDGSTEDQDMSFTLPLRVGRYLKMHLDKPGCAADPSQNDVRRRLTTLLNNRSMQISLDVMASMTNFSKSSLSLWRRGSYRGNNSMVAKAVAEALFKLEGCNYNYEPLVHDASCTVSKGRPFVKPTDNSDESNAVALSKKRRKLSD